MLDRLLRWLRIRRDPERWRVTGARFGITEWHDRESLADAMRLAGVLMSEGYSVKIRQVDRSLVITSQEAHE